MPRQTSHELKEAMLYTRTDAGDADCFLCSHRCHIKDSRRGVCRVRENRGGTLYSLVYGMAISANVDPIEKKPLFHVLPGTQSYSLATVGCNFKCDFCQNWQISQAASGTAGMPGTYIAPEAIVADAVRKGCASIAYTYTEPTIFFEYACDCACLGREQGLMNVFVTNGYQTPETLEKMAGLIDAANVDLKSFRDVFYRERCGARVQPVLDSIKRMHDIGIAVEVTTLVVPDGNDSDQELGDIAGFLADISPDLAWHVSRFHPDYRASEPQGTPSATIYRAVELGRKAGLNYVYAGNLPGGRYEDTMCPACGKTVIERHGFSVRATHLAGAKCGFCGQALPIAVQQPG